MADSVVLHRCPVPTDWLCACGRVSRELKNRGIDHEQVKEPLRRSQRTAVAEISGQRVLPVLEIDGEAICDSKRILERLALEDVAADPVADGD
jgi:glutathione S-transferase